MANSIQLAWEATNAKLTFTRALQGVCPPLQAKGVCLPAGSGVSLGWSRREPTEREGQHRGEILLPEPRPPIAENMQRCASQDVLKCLCLWYKEMFLFKQNSLLSLFPFSHLAQHRGYRLCLFTSCSF